MIKTSDILYNAICEEGNYLPGGLKVTINDSQKSEEVIDFLKKIYKESAQMFCDELLEDFDPEECAIVSIPLVVCEVDGEDDKNKMHPFCDVNTEGNVITLNFSDNVFEVYGGYDAIDYGNDVAKYMKKEMKANSNITEFEGFIGWWQTGGSEDDFCFAEISSTKENNYARELVNSVGIE